MEHPLVLTFDIGTQSARCLLVNETGVPVCVLDPLTSGPADPPADYYETVMLHNMKLLQEAFQ